MNFWDILLDVGKTLAAPFINYFTSKDTNDTNTENVEKTNKQNYKIHKEDMAYNWALTQQQWERDDNAHQREVADLKAAGLSPLANTTGSPVTSGASAPSPIAMQAPQIDQTALMNSIVQAAQLSENTRHNRVEEGYKSQELTNQAEQLRLEVDKLDLQNKQVEQTIKYQTDLINKQAETIAETKRHNDEEEWSKKVEYESEQYWKEIDKQTGGNIPYKDYYDLQEYESAINAWTAKFETFIKIELKATSTASSEGESSASSGGVSVVGNGVNLSGQSSSSNSQSENISQKQEALLRNFYAKNPMPVFHQQKWNIKGSRK